MANKTFNLDEERYNRFRRAYPQEMSKIINDFIGSMVDADALKSHEVAKVEAELMTVEREIRELKSKAHKLSVLVENKRGLIEKQEQAKTQEELDIESWANDVIRDAKRGNTYVDIVLRGEKLGLTPKDVLIKEWNEAKK